MAELVSLFRGLQPSGARFIYGFDVLCRRRVEAAAVAEGGFGCFLCALDQPRGIRRTRVEHGSNAETKDYREM